MMRTVIFDLDGTLADTSRDLIAAANRTFDGLGLGVQLDPLADAATALLGGRAMLRLGLERIGRQDADLVDAAYPRLLAAYAEAVCVHTVFFPGAEAAVARLRGCGIATGICTNKPEALARQVIAGLGAAHLFDSLIGADTLPVRKPDPAPYVAAVEAAGGTVARSLLVGDSATDVETARAAGVPVVLVGFGPGAAPDHLDRAATIGAFGELDAVVARLFD